VLVTPCLVSPHTSVYADMIVLTSWFQFMRVIVQWRNERSQQALLRDQDGQCFTCSAKLHSFGVIKPSHFCHYTGTPVPAHCIYRLMILTRSSRPACLNWI